MENLSEREQLMEDALYEALSFLEDLPSAPYDIIENINKALGIEY